MLQGLRGVKDFMVQTMANAKKVWPLLSQF